MADFRNYVSFEVPDGVEKNMPQLPDSEISALQGDGRALVERALAEIADTPEGEALLERVASKFPDGKISILHHEGGKTVAGSLDVNGSASNVILLGAADSDGRYYSPETDWVHDLSIQRTLFHELQHFGLGHVGSRGVTNHDRHIRENEAVDQTNEFMKKYYDEPARSINDLSQDIKDLSHGGTEEWDFSQRVEIVEPTGLDGWVDKLKETFCEKTNLLCEQPNLEQQHQPAPQVLEP